MKNTLVVVCVLIGASTLACGTNESTSGGDADPTADGGACIADKLPCGQPDGGCVGDCRGRTCCGHLCAGTTCSSANVDYATTCPSACGGNPEGTWQLVGACVGPCDGGSGAVAADKDEKLTVSADGGSGIVWGYDFHCGSISRGSGHGLSGTWSTDAGTVGGFKYCVEGGNLWVLDSPGLALKFVR